MFMVVAEPSDSLAGELRRLLPALRGIVAGAAARVLDRAAGPRPCSRTSPPPDSTCSPGAKARPPTFPPTSSPRSRAPTTAAGPMSTSSPTRPRVASATAAQGQTVTLRQVTRRVRQAPPADPRADLPDDLTAGRSAAPVVAVAEENYFRYARTRHWTPSTPTPPPRMTPTGWCPTRPQDRGRPRSRAGHHRRRDGPDAALLQLRSPAPGQAAYLTNQVINALAAR